MKKLRTGKDADESSLSHTKWNCMYHIVFIPKYRRKSIYGAASAPVPPVILAVDFKYATGSIT